MILDSGYRPRAQSEGKRVAITPELRALYENGQGAGRKATPEARPAEAVRTTSPTPASAAPKPEPKPVPKQEQKPTPAPKVTERDLKAAIERARNETELHPTDRRSRSMSGGTCCPTPPVPAGRSWAPAAGVDDT